MNLGQIRTISQGDCAERWVGPCGTRGTCSLTCQRHPKDPRAPLTGASDFHVPLLWGLRELGQHRAYPSAPACLLVRSRRWRLRSSSAVLHHTYSRPSPGAAIRRRGRAASFPIPPPPLRRSKLQCLSQSLSDAEKDFSDFLVSVETGALMGCRQQSPSGPGTSCPHLRFSCKYDEKMES